MKDYQERIEKVREYIDHIDNYLIDDLGNRMRLVDEVARLKKQAKVGAVDQERYNNMMIKRKEYAESYNLDPQFIEDIFNLIHNYSVSKISSKIVDNQL